MAASTKGYRYTQLPGDDNKHTLNFKEIQNPAYAATINIVPISPSSEVIVVETGTLTGALTLTADNTIPHPGDELTIILPSDATGRTTTFSTGFTVVGGATLAGGANQTCVIKFIYTTLANTWVEVSRAIN